METMETHRKFLYKQQTELRRIMMKFNQHDRAIELFLNQHAMLHSARVSQTDLWSFEDAVLDDMAEEQFRRIPRNCDHSVAWLIWHIARCEDITMNLLVAGSPQVLHRDNWLERMKITVRDTGNTMDAAEIVNFSDTIDIEALRAYRVAVGRRTREIVKQLQPEQLKQKVDPARLEWVLAEGAVVEAARELIDYWGGRTIAGLLLMPPTRHNFIHLNEARRVKRKSR
jgi:hypothetical protein